MIKGKVQKVNEDVDYFENFRRDQIPLCLFFSLSKSLYSQVLYEHVSSKVCKSHVDEVVDFI